MKPFEVINVLDSFVVNSHGAYTHDDAFKLPINFAMSLQLAWYEKNSFNERRRALKESFKKS